MTSISKKADETIDGMKDTAVHARGSLLELGTQGLRLLNSLRDAEVRGADALLAKVGLQRRVSVFVPIMWFAAGTITAGIVALAMTPKGKELRARAMKMFDEGVDKAKEGVDKAKIAGRAAEAKIENVANEAQRAVHNAAGAVSGAMESRTPGTSDEARRAEEARRNAVHKVEHPR